MVDARSVPENDREGDDALRQSVDVTLLLEKMPIPVIVSTGKDERVLFINEKFTELFGYTLREMPDVAHWWPLAYPDPEYRENVRRRWTEELAAADRENREIDAFTARITCRDQSVRYVSIRAYTVDRMHVIVFLDLTESVRDREGLERAIRRQRTLMEEMNHRVKNNLALVSSLLRLKMDSLDQSVDLSDIENQVDAIRLVHEKLQHQTGIDEIELKEYLDDVVGSVIGSISHVSISLVNRVSTATLSTRRAVPIGLVVSEIATNAVKHGYPHHSSGTIELSSVPEPRDRWTAICVTDDGAPIPESVELENPTSLGMQLIQALIAQIGGEIAIRRSPHPEYVIRFPSA